MYSMLKEIDKHIKKKDIGLKRMSINYDCLPDYINQAILYAIRDLEVRKGLALGLEPDFSLGVAEYRLKYDENGVLHLEVFSDSGHSRLLICNNPLGFSTKIPGYVITEKRIVEIACILKRLRERQLKLRVVLEKEYPDKSYLERLKMEYQVICSWVNEEISLRRDLGDSVLNYVDTEKLLHGTTDKIITCIDDVGSVYYNEIGKKDDMIDIVFISSGDEKEVNGFAYGDGHGHSKERVNEVIPVEDRKRVLKKHPYIFFANGYAADSEKFDYLCYLYKIAKSKYMLILEPNSGINYKKMIVIDGVRWISKSDFINLVKRYLEFSPEEILECKHAIRTTHTTLKNFRGNVNYAVTGKDSERVCSPYVRRRIMELRGVCGKKEQ